MNSDRLRDLRTNYRPQNCAHAGFTLAEVVIASGIAAITVSGIIYGYVGAAQRSEWSAYSLAAQSLAIQRMEQTRAAKWDLQATPPVDQLVSSNFPVATEILDVPASGTNLVLATNVTSILSISTDPPLRMIQVNCSWSFRNNKVFTNSMVTYRTADQ